MHINIHAMPTSFIPIMPIRQERRQKQRARVHRKMAKSSTSPSSLFRTELLLAVCLLDGALNLAFSPRTTKTTPTARPIMVASPRNSAVAPPPPPISRTRYSLLSMSPLDNEAPFLVEDEWQQPQGQYAPRDDGAGYKGAPSSVKSSVRASRDCSSTTRQTRLPKVGKNQL